MTRDRASLIKHIIRTGNISLACDMLAENGATYRQMAVFVALVRKG